MLENFYLSVSSVHKPNGRIRFCLPLPRYRPGLTECECQLCQRRGKYCRRSKHSNMVPSHSHIGRLVNGKAWVWFGNDGDCTSGKRQTCPSVKENEDTPRGLVLFVGKCQMPLTFTSYLDRSTRTIPRAPLRGITMFSFNNDLWDALRLLLEVTQTRVSYWIYKGNFNQLIYTTGCNNGLHSPRNDHHCLWPFILAHSFVKLCTYVWHVVLSFAAVFTTACMSPILLSVP